MDYHISSIAKRLAWGLLVLPLAAAFITGCSSGGDGGPAVTEGHFDAGDAGMGGGSTVIPPPAAVDESTASGTFEGDISEDETELVYTIVHDVANPTVLHFHVQDYAVALDGTGEVDTENLGPICTDCTVNLEDSETPGLIE